MTQYLDNLALREAAFDRLDQLSLQYDECIPWAEIEKGFRFNDQVIPFASKAVGIFKPARLHAGALSIKKVVPKAGRVNVYADSDSEDETGCFRYSLQGDNADNHHNRLLSEAHDLRLPIIYFYGVAPGIYRAIYPCYVDDIDGLFCQVSVSNRLSETALRETPYQSDVINKKYLLRETRVRLHQASFRSAVLAAYGNTCAMTGLPIPKLLDAAHIIPDAHPDGSASVDNGICLSKIHHKAYDANLIGIDPDYRIHVSKELLGATDGPILELCLKGLDGQRMQLPRLENHWPSRDALADRFSGFS